MSAVSQTELAITEYVERPYSEVARGYTPFSRGDVLVAKITPCFENGKMALVDKLPHNCGFGSTEFHVIRPQSGLDGRYLFHMLRGANVRKGGALRMKGAAGQKRVPSQFFANLQIPLPPLREQKRIAKILDQADALRAKRRKAIANLDTFLQSTFLDIFGDPLANPKGWKVKKLGEFVGRLTNGYVGPTRDIYKESGIPYLLARHVHDNRLQFDGKTFVSDEFNTKHNKSMLRAGDVLLVQSGHIGQSAVVPSIHEGHNCHAMIVISPQNDLLTGEYLSHMFQRFHQIGFWQTIKTGISVPHLNCRDVRKLKTPLPPFPLQQQFADIVSKVEAQERLMRDHLTQLDTQFAALQSRAFSGKL